MFMCVLNSYEAWMVPICLEIMLAENEKKKIFELLVL